MSPVLKLAGPSTQPSRRVPSALVDASEEGRRRLAAAEDGARVVLERAQAEAVGVRADAAARGREEGLASATEIVARAAMERSRLLASAEAELVDVAFEIARRVVAGAAERGAVVEIASHALEAARCRQHVLVRAHPDDLAALRAAEPGLAAALAVARGLALRGDAGIARGGVVVETEAGQIDARLETQLAALRRALEEPGP